jgi:hypothetical protein
MWNAMHGKALASAVVISVVLQGSMLWHFNEMASEGATPAVVAPAEPIVAALREVTLAPVTVVYRCETAKPERDMALASAQASETQARSDQGQHDARM